MDLKRAQNILNSDTDFEFASQYLEKRNKKTTKDQAINEVLLPIAHHESKLDANAFQTGGGPGRGWYQFEGAGGDLKKSFRTALRRSMRVILDDKGVEFTTNPEVLKKNGVPSYIIKAYDTKKEASDLTPGQQSAIALLNFLGHPNANIDHVTKNTNTPQTINTFWFENHWAGASKSTEQTKLNRRVSFSRDYDEYVTLSNKTNRVRHIREVPPNFK